MTATLRIFFDGLCGFVPDFGREGRKEDNLTVLLVNQGKDEAHNIPAHYPFLVFPKNAVEGPAHEDQEFSFQGVEYYVWQLNYEHLDLKKYAGSGSFQFFPEKELEIVRGQRVMIGGKPGNVYPVSSKEAEDFSWVTPTRPLHASGAVDSDLLDYQTKKTKAIARMKLTVGRLATFALARDPWKEHKIYPYAHPNDKGQHLGNTQAIAEVLCTKVQFTEKIQISTRPLRSGGHEPRSVTLKASSGSPIDIRLTNRPGRQRELTNGRITHHLRALYKLSSKTANWHKKPKPDRIQTIPLVQPFNLPTILRAVPLDREDFDLIDVPDDGNLCPFVQFAEASPPPNEE